MNRPPFALRRGSARTLIATVIGGSALAFVSACSSAPLPRPLVAPSLELGTSHYRGSLLSGSTPAAATTEGEASDPAANARLATCRVLYLETMPTGGVLDPLAARTRLIGAERGGDPVLASTVLTTGARIGSSAAASDFVVELEDGAHGRWLEVGELEGVLLDGSTVRFAASSADTIDVPDLGDVTKTVELHLSREPDGEPALVLVVVDEGVSITSIRGDEEEDGPVEAPGVVLHRETIVLEDRPGDGELVLLFHSPFAPPPSPEGVDAADVVGRLGAFAAIVEIAPDADPEPELVAEALAQVDAAAPEAESTEAAWASATTMESALAGLAVPVTRRAALLFLAAETDARFAEDLALSAEDVVVSAVAEAILEATGGELPTDAAAAGWTIESTALSFVAERQILSPPLPPSLSGALVRHAGEVGRLPSMIRELCAQSSGLDVFRQRLIVENRIFLEDSSPSARARANDWLGTMGAAPAGFDPLADREQRRAALREAAAAAAEAATAQGGAR